MATSYRHVLRGVHGRVRANFNIPSDIRSSQAVVHITAGEIIFTDRPSIVIGPHGQSVTQAFRYNLGDADIWVTNISPHHNDHFPGEPGGVECILHVDWDSPLDVAVTITVEDATPVEIN